MTSLVLKLRRAVTNAIAQNMQMGGFLQSVRPFGGRDFGPPGHR
jgi:hypothetical protein